ncbi:hypothetical protein QBC44DRAFT_353531 [Cladorrhinum sp. PSN332]|nr:hypothetical protein QBC44DRAFT_353531 [Cladorrhinum sp. PSN332]
MASTNQAARTIDESEAQKLISDAGQIHLREFRIALFVLAGISICFFLARMFIRIRYHKRLLLDDFFLILAACSMCAGTGLIYHISYFLYMHTAASQIPELFPYLVANYKSLLGMHTTVFPLLALMWTTIYAVKACFLVFMRPLVWHISKWVNRYYWFIVWFCVLCWGFVVAQPFITCPYFGEEAIKCFAYNVDKGRSFALIILVTVLDIVTDLMVVSLPIIILRRSRLSAATKFGLGVFLSLSIVMCIFAAVRAGGYHYNNVEDDTWAFFWMQAEGVVAIMMASLTAFRTLFIKNPLNSHDHNKENNDGQPPSLASSVLRRFLNHLQTLAQAVPEPFEQGASSSSSSDPEAAGARSSGKKWLKLPKMPSPVFTGVRSFISRNGRTTRRGGGESEMRTDVSGKTFVTMESTISASEADYHAQLVLREFESSSKQGGTPRTVPMTPRSAHAKDF